MVRSTLGVLLHAAHDSHATGPNWATALAVAAVLGMSLLLVWYLDRR
jgi:hypothetical protein